MKTLYVTDLDGTLLNSKVKLSEYTISAINDLINKGMCFTYATARSLVSASVVTSGLKINMPVVTFNGTFIIDPHTKKDISSLYFSEKEVELIKNTLIKYSVNPLVYGIINGEEKVSWIKLFENNGIKNYKLSRKGDKRLRPIETIEQLYQGNIFYFMCIGDKTELEKLYDYFIDLDKFTCTFQKEIYREEYLCEIYHKDSSKGNAIKKLMEKLECGKLITFGDAINDIPMFKISDECYAVENAVNELKECATGIIESNENDGVAKWLKKNYKLD